MDAKQETAAVISEPPRPPSPTYPPNNTTNINPTQSNESSSKWARLFRRKQKQSSTPPPPPQEPKIPAASYFRLYKEYTNTLDRVLMVVGLISSIAAGILQPLVTIIFGDLIDGFTIYMTPGTPNFKNRDYLSPIVNEYSVYFILMAVGMFITTYIYTATYIFVGERITHRIRQKFLKSVLRQEIAWYDSHSGGAGSVTTQIASDTLLVQDGVSEKFPMCFSHLSCFLAGFGVAFAAR